MNNPDRSAYSCPESIVGHSPLDIAMEAASASAHHLAGATLTAGQAQLLDFTAEHRFVEPLSSFSSAAGGIATDKQERTLSVAQNTAPALRRDPVTMPGALA
jgi:hypothetical protein